MKIRFHLKTLSVLINIYKKEVFPGQCFAPLKGKHVNWLCREQEK